MRLTQLKLAGFKSFVDATTLQLHGQRIGVVGPNGCGKSNVMESIRWVLGASSARELRGDSMQDVIFNGSANRKAIARASAELIFDNSLGGAGGAWAQYAEISVKRVIERDKGSSYFINNTPVRRRDVADLFLGTGLGGRAYAIIGQNTISRIVEARPEELRVFLEEAAGISKYKERRRETELRLQDTRTNLARVEDIQREIVRQIERLEAQAAVTQQYHQLQDALGEARGRLWLLKKRDAGVAWEKSRQQVEQLVNALEAQMAELRSTEALLETLRQQHFTAGAEVQAAQTRYYEVNAEVSSLEQQLEHTRTARERLQLQLQQMAAQVEKIAAQKRDAEQALAQLTAQRAQIETEGQRHETRHAAAQAAIPGLEATLAERRQAHSEARQALADSEVALRLAQSQAAFLARSCAELEQRLQQLQQTLQELPRPDATLLAATREQQRVTETALARCEQAIDTLQRQEQALAAAQAAAGQQQRQAQTQLTQIEAQLHSLGKIQRSIGRSSELETWLRQQDLQDAPRVWQSLRIADGWETALESVLEARLNGILCAPAQLQRMTRPAAATVLVAPADGATRTPEKRPFKPLAALVEPLRPALADVIQDWLCGVYLLEDAQDGAALRLQLQNGEMLVNRAGDRFTRHSLTYFSPQDALHGVLERQRELAALEEQQRLAQAELAETNGRLREAETAVAQARQQGDEQRQQARTLRQALHQQTLELQRLEQQRQHVEERSQALDRDRAQTGEKLRETQAQKQQSATDVARLEQALPTLQQHSGLTGQHHDAAQKALHDAQQALQEVARQRQENTFEEKLINNKINELENKINLLNEENATLGIRRQETQAQLDAARMETLSANLNAALARKQQHETGLAQARDALAEVENALQAQERNRMRSEQSQHPLRDRLEQSRLAEQQARLHFEQCGTELAALRLDENALAAGLTASSTVATLDRAASALQQQLEALGAVNLAAIQELTRERERQGYLASQSEDLSRAIATLEEAISRIDRETRSRLQHTFDTVNRNFAELFALLFGGGQAGLVLLGEEILDTGMQVFAQPPGKKNSTIQLLSGGEKALTALALVFALFRLNPAPFCLMDEVDAPLDDSNTERFCNLVKKMSERTQFLFVSHNKITMEMAQQLIGVTMQESGVSRIVEVDMEAAMRMQDQALA